MNIVRNEQETSKALSNKDFETYTTKSKPVGLKFETKIEFKKVLTVGRRKKEQLIFSKL